MSGTEVEPRSGNTSHDSRDSGGSGPGGQRSMLELLSITDAAAKAVNKSSHSASSHGSLQSQHTDPLAQSSHSAHSQGSKRSQQEDPLTFSQQLSDRSEKSLGSVRSGVTGASARSHVSEVSVRSHVSAASGTSSRSHVSAASGASTHSARSALSQASRQSACKPVQDLSHDSGVISKTQTASDIKTRGATLTGPQMGDYSHDRSSDESTTASDILIKSTHEKSEHNIIVNGAKQPENNGHSSSSSSKCSKTSYGVENFNSSGPQKVKISKKHLKEIKSPYNDDDDSPRTSVSSDGKVPSSLLRCKLSGKPTGASNVRNSADKEGVISSNDSNGEKTVSAGKMFPRGMDSQYGNQFKIEKVKKSAEKPFEDVNIAKSKPKVEFDKKSQSSTASSKSATSDNKLPSKSQVPSTSNGEVDMIESDIQFVSTPKYRVERHTPQKTQPRKEDLPVGPQIPEKKNLLHDLEDSIEIITTHAPDMSSGSSQPEIVTVPERIVTVSATNFVSPSSVISDPVTKTTTPPVTYHSTGYRLRDDKGSSGAEKTLDDSVIPPALSRNLLDGGDSDYNSNADDDMKTTAAAFHSKQAYGRGLRQGGMVDGPEAPDAHKVKDVFISDFKMNDKQRMAKEAFAKRQFGPVRRVIQPHIVGHDSKASSTSSTGELKPRQPDQGGSNLDQVLTTAAAASAAVAATQPFIKAQVDLELKMAQVLDKMEEISGGKTRKTDGQTDERVHTLERQLAEMTERRIEYMERLQEQQMAMQAKMLGMSREPNTKPYHPRSYSPESNLQVPTNRAFSKTTVTRQQPHKGDYSRQTVLDLDESSSPLDTPAPRARAPRPTIYDTSDMEIRAARARSPKAKSPHRARSPKTRSSPKPRSRSPAKEKQDCRLLHHILASDISPRHRAPEPELPKPFFRDRERELVESPNVRKARGLIDDLSHIKDQVRGLVEDKENYAARTENARRENNLDETKASIGSLQGPSPLDSYLYVGDQKATSPYKTVPDMSFSQFNAPVLPGFKEAENILKQVQQNRGYLEANMESVMRARQEVEVYSLLEAVYNDSTDHEKARIKKLVDKSIQRLRREVEREVTDDVVISEIKKKSSNIVPGAVKMPDPVPVHKSGTRYGLRRGLAQPKEEPKPETKKPTAAKKPRIGFGSREPAHQRLSKPVHKGKSVFVDEEMMTRVYGKATYQKGRTTVKDPYLHFQNTAKQRPARNPPPIQTQHGVEKMSSKTQTGEGGVRQFYFNPATGSYIPIASTSQPAPIPGQLIPMAVPLGGPRMDPGLTADASTTNTPMTFNSSKVSQVTAAGNVAMVTIGVEDGKSRKMAPELGKQVLPAVDIDTDISETSVSTEYEPMPVMEAAQSPERKPQTPERKPKKHVQIVSPRGSPGKSPAKSHFEVIYHEDDTFEDEEDDVETAPGLQLPGYQPEEEPDVPYNGPAFPPKLPSNERQLTSDLIADDIRRRDLLQNQANEWLEQELMARIISEVYPLRDAEEPPAELSHVVSEGSEDSMAEEREKSMFVMESIGHRGMQLFVDTGVPVDNCVVDRLVNEVLQEKIRNMLGERPPVAGQGHEVKVTTQGQGPQWEELQDELDTEQVQPQTRQVVTPEPTPQATPRILSPGPMSPAYTPIPSPPPERSPRVVERVEPEFTAPIAPPPIMQQPLMEPESEPESSASYDIQEELNRLADKLQPYVDPASSVRSRHEVTTPPGSPKPELHPQEPTRPLTPPDFSPRLISEEPIIIQSTAQAGTSLDRSSSRLTKVGSPKSGTSPQVTELAEEELAEDQPKAVVFTVAETQTDKSSEPRPPRTPSPAKTRSRTPSESSYTGSSSSISDTFNECVSEGQWLINKSDGEMPDFPINQAAVRERMLRQSQRRVDISSASTWKDIDDVDLEDMNEMSRSEGEFLYKADFPPEKDPVLDLLARLQSAAPQYGMYNMSNRQVTDVLSTTGKSEGEVIRVSAAPRHFEEDQIYPERDESPARSKPKRSKSPKPTKSQRTRSPQGGATYSQREESPSPHRGTQSRPHHKRAPSPSFRAQSPTRVSFEDDMQQPPRSNSPTRGILKRSSTFEPQGSLRDSGRSLGSSGGRLTPGARQPQAKGMMMAGGRTTSPSKGPKHRPPQVGRSSELRGSGGRVRTSGEELKDSLENTGGSSYYNRNMTPDQMNMDALIQSGYLSQSFSQSEGGRQTASLRNSADVRGSRTSANGQSSLGYSYGTESSMSMSEIQRLATGGTGKLQMSLTLPTGQEESDLSEIDITDGGSRK
ncbi:protein TALPID3-like isoform X2 [Mya arenaria]|uniref:protein TALPID3-like isoform X2 n=1 Tax=Mya arenaria TaxID=6604 RepID=UPI0022E61064|nr:protein TALPID3-like isoform X2 [Mya arenaria]